MIPAPDPKALRSGPFVLAENPASHTLVITTVRDWGDGKGPVPSIYDPVASWKQVRSGAGRGAGVVWRGYRPEDVAMAHHLLSLLNHHHECTS